MAAIETEGLTRLFGDRRAVDGVSMTVPDHSVYGVLGRNGAGKTTTMKMLTGLLRPSSGVARVCGVDVVKGDIGIVDRLGGCIDDHVCVRAGDVLPERGLAHSDNGNP